MKFQLANPIREEFRLSSRPDRARAKANRTRSDLIVIRVDSRVWKTAMKLANNDPRRIQVVSEEEVIVHNYHIR